MQIADCNGYCYSSHLQWMLYLHLIKSEAFLSKIMSIFTDNFECRIWRKTFQLLVVCCPTHRVFMIKSIFRRLRFTSKRYACED